MPKAVDKSICRYCRLSAPQVTIRTVKGKPRGECQDCNRKLQMQARLKTRFALGLYQASPELVAANLKTLASLQLGAYPLLWNVTKAQIGYIVVKNGTIYVNAWNDAALFHYRVFDVSTYLGNLNAFLDSKSIDVLDATGAPIALESIGDGMPVQDVGERLVWYDAGLVKRAMSLIRDEIKQAKQANMAIARSKNPKAKPESNSAE